MKRISAKVLRSLTCPAAFSAHEISPLIQGGGAGWFCSRRSLVLSHSGVLQRPAVKSRWRLPLGIFLDASRQPIPLQPSAQSVFLPSSRNASSSVTGTSDDGGIATWPRHVTTQENVRGHGSKGNFALLDTIHPIIPKQLIKDTLAAAVARYSSCSAAADKAIIDAAKEDGIITSRGDPDSPQAHAVAVTLLDAREGGQADAQFLLGLLLWRGTGVIRDHKNAVRWFTAAAAQGHPQAAFNLGFCHLKAWGCEPTRADSPQESAQGSAGSHARADAGRLASRPVVQSAQSSIGAVTRLTAPAPPALLPGSSSPHAGRTAAQHARGPAAGVPCHPRRGARRGRSGAVRRGLVLPDRDRG